ncbi:MAG: transposase [Phycisphaeraceae bacterium]|nr:transposase [Phycisphaeraceae bacterium]
MANSAGERRPFSARFKAKVAVEAVREGKAIAQLAGQYPVHPNQISEWKKHCRNGLVIGAGSSHPPPRNADRALAPKRGNYPMIG